VLSTVRNTAHDTGHVGHCRNHDHRNVLPLRMRLHALEHTKTINAGHHDVEEDEIKSFRLQPFQCVSAVHGTHAPVPEQLELLLKQIEVKRLGIDSEDPWLLQQPLSLRGGWASESFSPALTKPPAKSVQYTLLSARRGHVIFRPRPLC